MNSLYVVEFMMWNSFTIFALVFRRKIADMIAVTMKHIYFIILSALFSLVTFAQVPDNLESELVLLNVKTGKEK